MAAAARMSGTTLPLSSVRYRGVLASASARAEFLRAARMRATRALAFAAPEAFARVPRLAAAPVVVELVEWIVDRPGRETVSATAPAVAASETPSHRTMARAVPNLEVLENSTFNL